MIDDVAIIRACAKINLVLRVGSKRPDGYHEVVTLITRISLADVLLIDPAETTTVACPGLPGGDTLVTRSLALLCEAAGYSGGFNVHIDKRIPYGAGLGGGSANAAAALRFANDLLPQSLPAAEVARIAALIGSDVPALLHDQATLGRGRGEQIEVLGDLPRAYVALAHPGRPLATRDVYAHYRPDNRPLPSTITLPTNLDELAGLVENDLALPAQQLEPACGALRAALVERGALAASVSGSGSVVFGLFAQEQDAQAAIVNLPGAVWTTTAILGIR